MAQPYIAQISCFACSFSPRNWAFCSGQLLPIQQFTALFSILGTTYGGNGTTNFQLPDLRGRSPMHWGNGAGLSPTVPGEVLGSESVTLLTSNLPQHNHAITVMQVPAGAAAERTAAPTPTSYLSSSQTPNEVYQTAPSNTSAPFSPRAIGVVGQNLPHENRQPYLVLNICIALQGVFPSRN